MITALLTAVAGYVLQEKCFNLNCISFNDPPDYQTVSLETTGIVHVLKR